MAAENMQVRIVVDTSKLEAAMRRAHAAAANFARSTDRAFRSLERTHARAWYTDGDRHIERVIRDILAGTPGRPAAVRLLAASDLADVLDGGAA